MKARLIAFGEIEVEGERYEHDVVIDGGKVRKRKKGLSKQYREESGHTPLSLEEEIPWGGSQLIVGTGAYGRLPIRPEIREEAGRRGIEVVAVPTEEACRLLRDLKAKNTFAILHTTC
ncbi:MAG TPA: MTH938/NDUFAF3 family protein [Terrimicrobiaceae bacterium]